MTPEARSIGSLRRTTPVVRTTDELGQLIAGAIKAELMTVRVAMSAGAVLAGATVSDLNSLGLSLPERA